MSHGLEFQQACGVPRLVGHDHARSAAQRRFGRIHHLVQRECPEWRPAAAGSVIQVWATGGGTVTGGATDGALASAGEQTLPVTARIGGKDAAIVYSGPAPGAVNGVLQVNMTVPSGLVSGPQPVVTTVGGVSSQDGISVAVK